MNGVRVKVNGIVEFIPEHRVIVLACDKTTCTLVYKPYCYGVVEQEWLRLKKEANDASMAFDRCCTDGELEPRPCDPSYAKNLEQTKAAYAAFLSLYPCERTVHTAVIERDHCFYSFQQKI